MDINEALGVANEFNKYLKTGNDAAINSYTRTYIQSALVHILAADRNQLWYKAMEKRIVELDDLEKEKRQEAKRLKDKKWWHDPLLVGIISAVVGVAITGIISIYISQLEHRDRIKEISALQEIIKNKNSELTKSISEKDRLRAEIKDAIDSGDPSKIASVLNELNYQK